MDINSGSKGGRELKNRCGSELLRVPNVCGQATVGAPRELRAKLYRQRRRDFKVPPKFRGR